MKTKDILKNVKDYLENDNFEELDQLFLEVYWSEIPEEHEEKLSDILDEATLYLEFKEQEYKDMALKLISEF